MNVFYSKYSLCTSVKSRYFIMSKGRCRATEIRDAEAYLSRENSLKILPFAEFQQRFEVKQKLGTSIYTEVFFAHDRETDRDCAVKSFKKSALAPSKQVWGELAAVYTLESASLLRLLGAYASPTELWIVTEYANTDLREAVARKGAYGEGDVVAIVKALVSALAEIHKRGMSHGDVKPENVLFVGDEPRLADTGACQLLSSDSFTKTCAGSPDFVAPEVIVGGRPGKEADMWGVGVLAHLLLTGSVPFASQDLFQVYRKIVKAELEMGEEVSEHAQEFIKACLVADPSARLTAEAAEAHPWLTEEQDKALDCKDKIVAVLDERRKARVNRDSSFVAKMKANKAAKAAEKNEEEKHDEGEKQEEGHEEEKKEENEGCEE